MIVLQERKLFAAQLQDARADGMGRLLSAMDSANRAK